MNTKLTLKNYFNLISEGGESQGIEISPAVKELSGIVKLDKNFDPGKEFGNHLMEKYG